jgi:hypothetical protein
MCPDPEILSVYFDGELPAPWKEEMARHLESCPDCRRRYDRYQRSLAFLFNDGKTFPAPAVQERVWQKVRTLTFDWAPPSQTPKKQGLPIWKRRVSIPLPLAAAALAVLALTFFFNQRGAAPRPAVNTAADRGVSESGPIALDLPVPAFFNDLSSLADESADQVILQLPDSSRFSSYGEPALIKAADYSRGSRGPAQK